jgi:predicted RND superfamily exporter protein
VDTAYVDYLHEDHPANRDRREVLSKLAGPIPLRVVLDAGTPEGALEPELLARLAALQRHAEALPGVHASYSLGDLLADMNRAWHAEAGDPEAFRRPPGSAALAAQYLLLYESSRFAQDLERLIAFDRDQLAVWLRTDLYRSQDATRTLGALQAYLDRELADLSPRVSGTLAMLFRSSDEISSGQTRSLLLALVVIGAIVMAVFRSLRLGLAAAVPNLLPVLLLFGAMGAVGVPLNVGTCVVACLCLGVATDDTIHFVLAWREASARCGDARQAVREAFARVGRPILQTSLVLAGGFSVLAFSSFQPIAHLGWLSALTMAACLLGDLLLLPALLARMPVARRD